MSASIDVIILKPTKSAMQSGVATNKFWVLKYVNKSKTNLDPLMGWSGSDDTSKQINLKEYKQFLMEIGYLVIGVQDSEELKKIIKYFKKPKKINLNLIIKKNYKKIDLRKI